VLVLGMFMAMSGGCGDGGENHGADPVPEGNWLDVGNYDTTWYYDGRYEISTAKELVGLAKLVNDGTTFENETINITGNIDLGDHYWTPISNVLYVTSFRGTLNGRGNTISNLTVLIKETHDEAIIGVNDGTVANVRMTNVVISGANDGLIYTGGLVG
jgi:hypothetical protein